ncbi:DUF1707 SHOCT-like domain-containing protein [Salininema proteolyticum]|uniref:DUF1707 domain-containing protein n=1 Tax=Salininema proteolyticum TaxID=1607685 RepID=A0ABV8U0A8_9ACTN
MDPYDIRASRADRRYVIDCLDSALKKGHVSQGQYRSRRQEALAATTVGELQHLLDELSYMESVPHDSWRYGHWRGPVREGRELELQRAVGLAFFFVAVVVVVLVLYVVFTLISDVL